MENNLSNVLLTVSVLLKKHEAEYLLIGGTAIALHGYFRHSVTLSGETTEKPDIDIWFNPTYENYFRILKVIENLGLNVAEYINEENPNPKKSFFKLEFDDFTFDILPNIKADISFNDAFSRKETITVNGTEIYYLSFNDLINDKQTTARKKDIDDLRNLSSLNNDLD
jgi:hypothetical protein